MAEALGVIADIHGNALALKAVLAHARLHGVRRLVNLGDILYGPLWPLDTYRLLKQAEVVASIRGNQDRQIIDATEPEIAANPTLAFVINDLGPDALGWLHGLPRNAVVDGEVFLCHGTPTDDATYLLEDVRSQRPVVREEFDIVSLLGTVRNQVILCGHSHLQRVIRLSSGQLIVNPGSVGLPAYEDAIPEHRMESYSPHASYAVLERTESGWDVALHRVSYDWNSTAKRASELGRNDWARGLATGRTK